MPLPEKPLPTQDLPADIGKWLQEKYDEAPSRVCDPDVVDILVAARLQDQGKWVDALAVLKKLGLTRIVRPIVDGLYKDEMVKRLASRRRASVNTTGANFIVQSFWIYDSGDPVYELEVLMGKRSYKFMVTDPELNSCRNFKSAFRRATKRQPQGLPTKTEEWEALVGQWLDGAHEAGTVVEMPEEASEAGQIRDLIRELVWDRMVGEGVEDFEAGRLVPHPTAEGRFLIKGSRLRGEVHKRHKERGGGRIPAQLLGFLLKALRVDLDERVRIESRQVRAYSFEWSLGAATPPPVPGSTLESKTKDPGQTSLLN